MAAQARAPMPKSEGKPGAAGSIIAFAPGAEHGVKKLNGVALSTPYDPPADWAGVEGRPRSTSRRSRSCPTA
jgi:hypothetical protein